MFSPDVDDDMMIGVPQIPTNHYSAAEIPPPEENPHVDYSFLDLMLGPDDKYDCPVKHEPVHSDLILANDTEPLEIDVTLRSLVTAQNLNGFLEEQLDLVRSRHRNRALEGTRTYVGTANERKRTPRVSASAPTIQQFK